MQAATNNKSNSLLNSAGVTKEEKKPGMFASETKKRKFPILWAACILLFFCPGYFENVPWATGALQVLAAGRYVVSGVAIVAMVMRQHDRPLVWLLALYQVCVVVSGMLLGDINLTYALSCLTFIGLIAINIELYKQYQMSLINCYYWILLILLLGNAVTQIIFPSGLIPGLSGDRRIWLLGPKNSVTLIYILFSCCAFLQKHPNENYCRRSAIIHCDDFAAGSSILDGVSVSDPRYFLLYLD